MGKLVKKFTFKEGYDCKTLVIRELTGIDEMEAAVWADKHSTSAVGTTARNEQAEAMRLSIVEVDGKKVVQPYMQIDDWGFRTIRLLRECFAEVNGVDPSEVKNVLAEAEIIGTTPNSAADLAVRTEEQSDG